MAITFTRRGVLGAGVAASAFAVMPAFAETLSKSTIPVAPFVEVETVAGKIRGGTARGALSFKGIPYGGSLSGANRFKAPTPVAPWTGVFDATHLGAPSQQTPGSTYGEQEPAYSEDCLVLNVWTPAADGKKRPVMVYLHGGGFSTGSGGSTSQDGGRLAAVYDVVVVSCNHRLGLLGYLWLGEGYAANAGMLDIVQSLQWVRDNIAAFGGDPGNVTVFGESGGGAKVATLLAMPQGVGLYHKAGIESGAWLKRMPADRAQETARRFIKAVGVSDAGALANVPVQTLLQLQWQAERGEGPLVDAVPPEVKARMMYAGYDGEQIGHFAPVVDGTVLPRHPFDPDAPEIAAHVPLLIGNNREEAAFGMMGQPELFSLSEDVLKARLATQFGERADPLLKAYRLDRPGATPSELYIAIATARQFGNDTATLAGRKAAQAAPVWRYRWDYRSNRPIKGSTATLGAGHATDIGPTFDNWDAQGLHGDGPGVEAASHNLSALWTSFARHGVPTAKGVPAWPHYDGKTRPVMLVDVECRVVHDPDPHARKVWGAA